MSGISDSVIFDFRFSGARVSKRLKSIAGDPLPRQIGNRTASTAER
jgi:hypothetical protein